MISEDEAEEIPLHDIDLTFRTPRGPSKSSSSSSDSDYKMMIRIACMAALYYPMSIGLTFYQKWFLKQYKRPLIVVSGHYICKYLLAVIIRFLFECIRKRARPRLSFREQIRFLAPIGICASLDIGLSNWGLEFVTISLYTMAKSSSIVFIVAFSLLLRLERWRTSLAVEAALIAVGLFLFTYKSVALNLKGLLLVELASVCTGVRWTVSQLLMQREEHGLRHPLDMVAHVQPWMLIPILPLVYFIEGSDVTLRELGTLNHGDPKAELYSPQSIIFFIFAGGFIAFCLELSEYLLLVNTSGITLNIFGIIKEVITLTLAAEVNGDQFSSINVIGLALCLSGTAVHSFSRRRSSNNGHGHLNTSEDARKLLEDES